VGLWAIWARRAFSDTIKGPQGPGSKPVFVIFVVFVVFVVCLVVPVFVVLRIS
jgi:hypothetical protein